MVNNRRGYTLVEVMIVVAILGIISTASALMIQKTIQAQAMADALTNIQQGAFTSYDVISKLLRQASASSVVIDRYDANQPPWSRITFTMPSTGATIQLSQRGQTLYINNTATTKDLRILSFCYPQSSDPTVLMVSMTFEQSVGGGQSKAIQLFIQRVKIQNS